MENCPMLADVGFYDRHSRFSTPAPSFLRVFSRFRLFYVGSRSPETTIHTIYHCLISSSGLEYRKWTGISVNPSLILVAVRAFHFR